MTPSITPNWDSMPQNHPNPKDAVSETAGTDASRAGITGEYFSVCFSRLMELSFELDSLLPMDSLLGVHPHNNRVITRSTPNASTIFGPVLPMVRILAFEIHSDDGNRHTITMIFLSSVKI
jgi:hypothetical protein